MGKRNLYLSNTPVEKALEMYKSALAQHIKHEYEILSVQECLGRVTAQAVFARFNSPLYDSAAMDGIAVTASNTAGARETNPKILHPENDFIIVDTGDPIHSPFDAVIMAEELEELQDGSIQIRSGATAWQHVRPVGEDIVQGELILPAKHKIRPVDIGVLLSGGITKVKVVKRPRVAIFPTGTELVQADCEPKEGDIIESNASMFAALTEQNGGEAVRFHPLADEYEKIRGEVLKAVHDFDMVIINAGSSAGTEDYTVHVLRELGEVIVHGVSMKPGKPTILAIVNGKPVIGLPGYPVSAFLAYQQFVMPVLSMLTDLKTEPEEIVNAVITRRLVSSIKYKEFVRVTVGKVGSRLVAAPLARGAGSAMSLVRSDGFCVIDQDSEGVEAGDKVTVILNRKLSDLNNTLVSIGSHDLILDILSDVLSQSYDNVMLASTHVGSMGGLLAMRRGEAHIAPVHLLDTVTGVYNRDVIKRLFPDRRMVLIRGVGREQGLIVQKGNPLGIKRIEDLTCLRYINRQRGAGTRVLLDYLIEKYGIEADRIEGYDREAATHMTVAAAVKSGSADAGLGIYSVAKTMGLDFIPIDSEEYDFAVPEEFLELKSLQTWLKALKSEVFLDKVQKLGGYTVDNIGNIINL